MTIEAPARPPLQRIDRIEDVCSLSPEELTERRALVKREIRPHWRRSLKLENGLAFDFEASPEVRAKLEMLVELERQCCGPLEFAIRPSGETLRLEILGADPNSKAFEGLAARQAHEPAVASAADMRHGLARLAKTGGVAAAASFFLFCIVPIAVVWLVGASAAAPLMKLDNPWVVGVGALVLGAGIWQIEKGRSARKRAMAADGSDCGC